MPALVAKALSPTYGAWRSGLRFSTSSRMRLACVSVRSRSGVTPVWKCSANSLFRSSVGMIDVRLALPQRSPMPLSVPWMWRTPARTAISELATAFSVSLWVWMPRCVPGTTFVTSPTMRSTSCGSVPPLVSHSTTQRAPAS